MTTGEKIKNERKKAGLTQKQLGERLGVSFQAVAQWENDFRRPKYETIIKIADALMVQPEDILGDRDIRIVRITNKLDAIDSEFKKIELHQLNRLTRAYEKLSTEGKEVAIERVEELAQLPKYQKHAAGDSTQSAGTGDENDLE